jgi:hypothetical protein
MKPNGSRLGNWLLNTADNRFGPVGDFDGDGTDEILVTSPWGIGILKLVGGEITVPMMQPNGTRFGNWLLNTADNSFGPCRDFDGDGKAELLVVSPWGMAMLKQSLITMATVAMHQNGTRLGQWLLNTAEDSLGTAADFDGDSKAEILATSPWGMGILKLVSGSLTSTVMVPNGKVVGGWTINTSGDDFGHGL